jgi:hypothetical protein
MTRPLEGLIGKRDEPPECRVLGESLSVHWFLTDATTGDRCICGATMKAPDP